LAITAFALALLTRLLPPVLAFLPALLASALIAAAPVLEDALHGLAVVRAIRGHGRVRLRLSLLASSLLVAGVLAWLAILTPLPPLVTLQLAVLTLTVLPLALLLLTSPAASLLPLAFALPRVALLAGALARLLAIRFTRLTGLLVATLPLLPLLLPR
jgi:hypothetical protein